MKNKRNNLKKGKTSNFSKLSIFQPNKYRFKKACPLSVKNAPKVDYKNIKLLKRFVSENGKILPQELQMSHKKTTRAITFYKRARNLANLNYESDSLENLAKIGSIVK